MAARTARQGGKKAWAAATALSFAAFLAGCNAPGFGSLSENPAAPTPKVDAQPLAGPNAPIGQTLGSGPVRVGMILPLTQNGAPSGIGQSLIGRSWRQSWDALFESSLPPSLRSAASHLQAAQRHVSPSDAF